MDSELAVEDLVAPLREEVVAGAATVGRLAAEILRRGAIRLRAGSPEQLRDRLGELCRLVLDAQPSMAPLVALVRDVMAAAEGADSLEHCRHMAADAAGAFRSAVPERSRLVAQAAVHLLPVGGSVATISQSGTVRSLLSAEARPRGISVVCFESRPMSEGRALAEALAGAGIDVTYAVDAAIDSLAPGCDAVLLGADSVGDRGVVNKIGSAALAKAAAAAGAAVYVLADESKMLPRGFPQIVTDDRPADEVWPDAGRVRIWNRYFEVVPTSLVTAFVTERGPRTPAEIETLRGGMELPQGLKAWASASVGSGPSL